MKRLLLSLFLLFSISFSQVYVAKQKYIFLYSEQYGNNLNCIYVEDVSKNCIAIYNFNCIIVRKQYSLIDKGEIMGSGEDIKIERVDGI
jgi:hypothetical protein